MKTLNKLFLGFFLLSNLLIAEEFNIDDILLDIEKKTDLSEKTKLANSGVSFIYTRDDINRMQIKNLKDILKSVYPLGYSENRYGLVDPFTYGSILPFMSSQVKLFIDNQEITAGMYGSGLYVMGDLNIQWVDHIEIYTQNPTYEYSSEAAITLIKLYTKSAKKDEGGKISLGAGSYGASNANIYYAQELNDWSYFAFLSNENDKRKTHYSHDTKLSRDKKTNLTIATLTNNNHNILLTMLQQERDGFLDLSLDGTPTSSTIDAEHLHIGYDGRIKNLSYLMSYDYFNVNTNMTDDVSPIYSAPFYGSYPIKVNKTETTSKVFTTELKYNLNAENNKLILGLKYRLKKFNYDTAMINDIDLTKNTNDSQILITPYFENQYYIDKNSIITAGAQYSKVKNNHSVQNENLLMYRLGHTFTNKNFTFKTIASHTLMTLEQYLIDSDMYLATPDNYYKPQEANTILENIIYIKGSNTYEFILDYTKVKNYLVSNLQGKLETFNENVIMKGTNLRWTSNYNKYDKLYVDIGYRVIENVPNFGELRSKTVTIKNINTYKKFDIFNEILYNKDNASKKDFFDYSIGVKYNYSKDFIVSLKGVNLFDKARTTTYYRKDSQTIADQAPLQISPIDKKVTFDMEYTF